MTERERIIGRLQRGDVVHMQLLDGVRQWWFESPRLDVDDDTMRLAMLAVPELMEFGDSLFGLRGQSQTWRSTTGGRQ